MFFRSRNYDDPSAFMNLIIYGEIFKENELGRILKRFEIMLFIHQMTKVEILQQILNIVIRIFISPTLGLIYRGIFVIKFGIQVACRDLAPF
jgi:hypothetical protein